MTISCTTKDLENQKFRECPADSGLVVVATELCNVDELANAINQDDNGVSECEIVNIAMVANTPITHNFPDGTNRFRIKTKDCAELEVSTDNFVSGDIYTIDMGCEWSEDRIKLENKTVYLRSDIDTTLQIAQWV